MKNLLRLLLAVSLAVTALVPLAVGPAAAVTLAALPTEDPSNFTPNVLNGQVNSIWQVGSKVVVGGTFTQIANSTENGGTVYNRTGIAAFDAATGVVDTAFAPTLGSSSVEVVIPAGDGATVYLGGDFNTVNGTNRRKVARIDLATGALVTTFNANGVNGLVRDLRLAGGTLYMAGLFTTVGGQARSYLASLDPSTGALTSKVNLAFAGLHNGGVGKVIKIDVTPNAGRLLIEGNFLTIGGQGRDQVALIDISTTPATLSPWQTNFFNSACSTSFDSFLRDLDISEDGSFAVFTTTGAYRANTSCDTVSRFELTNEAAGLNPSWVSYTGGDTSYAAEIHDGVAYIGGHMRWFNNSYAADQHGAGGVAREGMGALDVRTGLPYSWDPGRERGVGLFDYHVTEQGLWAGSDTDRFNDEQRQRLAFFRWDTGVSVPANEIGDLPNGVFQLGRSSGTTGTVDAGVLYRINAGGPALPSADDGPDWLADTANSSSYRNTGSGTSTAPNSLSTPVNDAAVPIGDLDRPPAALWTTERYDPSGGQEMDWTFPVTAGVPIQVRLYLANRYNGTNDLGERIFDVQLDGVTVLDDLDLSGTVGHDIGTMRSFDVVSDGAVNIGFRHGVIDNPLVNGIEIIRTDVTPSGTLGTQDEVTQRTFDGVNPPTGNAVLPGTVPWRTVRGAFMVNSTVYTLHSDGTIMRRALNGSAFGAGTTVDMWSNTIMADIPTMTGVLYDPATDRIYYTLSGQSSLFYRQFSPQDQMVHAVRSTSGGDVAALNPTRVGGMFLGAGQLWFVDSTTGHLWKTGWSGGAPSGTPVLANSTADWRGRAVFRTTTAQPNVPPSAAFTSQCTVNSCDVNGSASTDPDGTITSYAWDFGDGSSATGVTATHAYAAGGTYPVTLTVTDDRGGIGTTLTNVTVSDPPNVPPTAAANGSCLLLQCTLSGTGSTDSDGTIASYAWDFGDGTTGSGSTASHAYASGGSYPVVLTVTDDDGASDTASIQVDAVEPTVAANYRASASANSSSASASVAIPAAVQAGDQLVYVVTANAATTATTPAGWTLIGTAEDGTPDLRSWVFGRTADAASAGSTVTSTFGTTVKSARTLVAYQNALPATVIGSSVIGATSNQLTTPSAQVTYVGSAVISYWSDKSGTNTGWTTPVSVALRQASIGTGTGRITAAIGDANPAAGTWPGATATSTATGTKGIGWTIVLPPSTGNLPPVASLSRSCASLTCSFDASASTDPDGTIASYAWDFGDGTTGIGATATHTYAAAGTYSVTVTVTDDDGASDVESTTVQLTVAVAQFRASASTNVTSTTASVQTPASVQSGDRLLLFVAANAATTAATPAGWTLLGSTEAGAPDVRSWVFTRTADATSAGSTVQSALGVSAKVSSTLLAYSGAAPVTTAASAVSPSSSTTMTTPALSVGTSGSQVVSYWVDKTGGNTGWTLPATVTARQGSVGAGSGRVTATAGDTAVLAGSWPGATATSTTAGSKAIGWSVLVAAP